MRKMSKRMTLQFTKSLPKESATYLSEVNLKSWTLAILLGFLDSGESDLCRLRPI